MLEVPPTRRNALLEAADLSAWREKDFNRYLKGGPLERCLAIHAGGTAEYSANDYVDEFALVPTYVSQSITLRRSNLWMPDRVVVNGVTLTFDNCTHSSAERRMSTRCGHVEAYGPACYKCRILSKSGSSRDTLAWLYCWATHGVVEPTKESHRYCVPTASSLTEAGALVDDLLKWHYEYENQEVRT